MSPKEEKVLASLYRSRKSFIPEYACALFLLVLLAYFQIQDKTIPSILNYFIWGLLLLALASAELSRALIHYEITPEKVIITHGFIRKHQQHINFSPLGFVPAINVKQGVLQRIFNYGTVFVHDSGECNLEIKDVNDPHQLLAQLEQLIEENRNKSVKS